MTRSHHRRFERRHETVRRVRCVPSSRHFHRRDWRSRRRLVIVTTPEPAA